MALAGTASTWRDAIVANLDLTGLSVAEENIVKSAWLNICSTHITHITGNSLTLTTGVTGTGSPGGPLPIVVQPGVIT